MIWIVKDWVCPGWESMSDNRKYRITAPSGVEREATNDEWDQLIVDESRTHGVTLITRDRGMKKRARVAGVPVTTPTEFAENVIAWETARTRFLERLDTGRIAWLLDHQREPNAVRAMIVIRNIFEAVWKPRRAKARR